MGGVSSRRSPQQPRRPCMNHVYRIRKSYYRQMQDGNGCVIAAFGIMGDLL